VPLELVKDGRRTAREEVECPYCHSKIIVKYDTETKEVLWVSYASNPHDGIITCYECKAELRWTPP